MKVDKIEVNIESVSLKTFDDIEFVSVKIICDNGSFTVGETTQAKDLTNESIETIVESISNVKKVLIGLTLHEAIDTLHTQNTIGPCAKAALDSALMVLLAQSKKQPLFEYLGSKNPKLIQTIITINQKSISAMLQDIKDANKNGMYILKLKFSKNIDDAIELMRIAYKLTPRTIFMVDPDMGWSKAQTIDFIDKTKNTSIEFIEQPIDAKKLDELKEISTYSQVPIVADESVLNIDDMKKVIESKSAKMINIKLLKCGGVSKAIEMLEYARKNNIKCVLGSMLEGPFSINTALHVAIAYSDVIKYVDLDTPLLYQEYYDELEFEYDNSHIKYKY